MPFRIMSRAAFVTLAAVVYAALSASQVSAQQSGYVHPLVQECRDAFDASPVNRLCSPDLWAHAVGPSDGGRPSNTCWVTGSCTILVSVGDTDTPFSVNVPYGDPMYLSPAELTNLDLCFGPAADGSGWAVELQSGCTNAMDSATAKSLGLPAVPE